MQLKPYSVFSDAPSSIVASQFADVLDRFSEPELSLSKSFGDFKSANTSGKTKINLGSGTFVAYLNKRATNASVMLERRELYYNTACTPSTTSSTLGEYYYFGRSSREIQRLHAIEDDAKLFLAELQAEPVVDGFTHPAQPGLARFFERWPDRAPDWIYQYIVDRLDRSSLVADPVRLLARIVPFTKDWRRRVISTALRFSID